MLYPNELKIWHLDHRESSRGWIDRNVARIEKIRASCDRPTSRLWRGRNSKFSVHLGIRFSASVCVAELFIFDFMSCHLDD
jgi:hypothetical protein